MDLGWPEILLILVIVLVVFGAGKIPNVARDLGKGVREFRKAMSGSDEEKTESKNDAVKAAEPAATATATTTAKKD